MSVCPTKKWRNLQIWLRPMGNVQVKVNVSIIYSALFVVPHTQAAQAWITQFHLQLHQCLPLPRKRSPDSASPDWGCAYPIAAYYSFIHPERMKGWVGLVGWLQPTLSHISGHPSAADRAQDRESSPVKDRRSTNCATNCDMIETRTMWKLGKVSYSRGRILYGFWDIVRY